MTSPRRQGGLASSRPLSSDRPRAQVALHARGALRLRHGSRQQICQSPLFQEDWPGRDQGRGRPGTLWTLGLPGKRKTQYPEVRRFQKGLADLRADVSPHLGTPEGIHGPVRDVIVTTSAPWKLQTEP